MTIYLLTQTELEAINALNTAKTNTLLIPCSYPEGTGVSHEALLSATFAEWLALLDYDPDRVVEIAEEVDIEQLRHTKRQAVEAWYEAAVVAGYDTGKGFALAIAERDQHVFTSYQVALDLALRAEQRTLEDGVAIYDIEDVKREMTVAEFIEIALGYSAYVEQVWHTRMPLLNAIKEAATVEELEAIEVP